MAALNRERVEHALTELLARIVPDDPDEDEKTANERFEAAFDFGIEELSNAGPLPVADITHVAGQIDQRCKHDMKT
jgi:gamma-tubulin complex component 3